MQQLTKTIILISAILYGVVLTTNNAWCNIVFSDQVLPIDDSTNNEKLAEHPTTATSGNKIKQRFNPIFSNEEVSNQILSFVAANLEVELQPEQMESLNGYLVINFIIDTTGNIDKLKVSKPYKTWVDYAIIGAMTQLPKFGTIFYNKRNQPVVKHQQLVFSFGDYVKGDNYFGFQDELVRQNTQDEVNRQRDEHFAKTSEHWNSWNKFTDINSKLEYDIKRGLKQEATTLDNNKKDDITAPPIINPTITITQRD